MLIILRESVISWMFQGIINSQAAEKDDVVIYEKPDDFINCLIISANADFKMAETVSTFIMDVDTVHARIMPQI